MVSFSVSLKQVLRKFAFASKASGTQTEIQRVYTGLGAEFGQPLTLDNITFAIKREPVAHRIVFAVVHDIFDNWFKVEPVEEGINEDACACKNALARLSQFRQEYEQNERNIIYERIVKKALKYGTTVHYNPELPEAKALPENIKNKWKNYESADSLIAKAKILIMQLKTVR